MILDVYVDELVSLMPIVCFSLYTYQEFMICLEYFSGLFSDCFRIVDRNVDRILIIVSV